MGTFEQCDCLTFHDKHMTIFRPSCDNRPVAVPHTYRWSTGFVLREKTQMFPIRKSGISMMLAALWLSASGSLPAQTFTSLYKFGSGGPPTAGLVEGADGNLYGTTYGYSGKQNGMIFKITPSGTFTTLHSGGAFAAGLIPGTDGNFYGTSLAGGTLGYGW